MNEYSVVNGNTTEVCEFDSHTTTNINKINSKIMIRYNGKYYKLILRGHLVMVSRNKSKCYEKLFSTMSYV